MRSNRVLFAVVAPAMEGKKLEKMIVLGIGDFAACNASKNPDGKSCLRSCKSLSSSNRVVLQRCCWTLAINGR